MSSINKCILLLLFVCSNSLFAQINKGSIYLGVNMGAAFQQAATKSTSAGISLTSSNPEWNSVYSFAPSFGYFFNSKFSAGLRLGMNYSSYIIQASATSSYGSSTGAGINLNSRVNSFTYFISPNIGYTIPFSEKLYLMNQAVFYFSYSSTPFTATASATAAAQSSGLSQSATVIIRDLSFAIQPTLVYFLHKRVSVNFSLGSLFSINNLNAIIITQNNYTTGGSVETVTGASATNFSFLGISTNLSNSSNLSPATSASSGLTSNSLMPTLGVYFWLK